MLCVLLWRTFVLILQDVTWGWDTMHSHVVWAGRQLVVQISSVNGLDVQLGKSERVIPACSRAGSNVGLAFGQVRARQCPGWGQPLDATETMAHGLLQKCYLLFPGEPSLLEASASSVLHF